MTRRPAPLVLTASLATLAAAGPASRPADPPLNAAVLRYAADHVGRTVGDGQCTALAAAALRAAGARPNRGYVWGRPLAPGEAVRAGDVMQFEACEFDGRDARHWWRITLGTPHHTAVVKAVLAGRKVEIYQQNPGPVNVLAVDFADLKRGTFTTFRPEPRDG